MTFRDQSQSNAEDRLTTLEQEVFILRRQLQDVESESVRKLQYIYDLIWKSSYSRATLADVSTKRYMPVRMLLSDDGHLATENIFRLQFLQEVVGDLLSQIGFSIDFELPVVSGSFKVVLGAVSRWLGTQKDVEDRLYDAEKAAKTVLLDKPIAEVTRAHADAAAALLREMKDYDQATVAIGSLLLVKETTSDGRKVLTAGTLSGDSLRRFESSLWENMLASNAREILRDNGHKEVVEPASESGVDLTGSPKFISKKGKEEDNPRLRLPPPQEE